MAYRKLPRTFYTRQTLLVARQLLGTYLVHQLPEGLVRGRIVETEAYPGIYDPASHTYKDQRTPRNQIWYGPGGFAYVYQIYGSYVCLGIITEPEGIPGAVLIRALEPVDGQDLLVYNSQQRGLDVANPHLVCAGPSKLCIAMGIEKSWNGQDLCNDALYLEAGEDIQPFEEIVFTPRINIDYAGAGALYAWRYYIRGNPACSRKTYEPLRTWRVSGYPSQTRPGPLDLFSHLAAQEAVSTMSEEWSRQVRTLPKVELHLHLEGCMTVPTMHQLAARNHIPLPAHLVEKEMHAFGTFDEFVHMYYSICRLLVHEQDFALLVADLATYVQENNICYCEVSWTPFLYLNRGLRFEAIMSILNEALETHGIRDRVNFLIDIQRDHGLESGEWVYHQVFAARDCNIVGVGLTGLEMGFPPAEYKVLYQQAREHGFGCTAHAGEYGTAQDIWQCVQTLGVSRVGHGLCAAHDLHLLQTLAEQHIHLEVCLTSNIRLERVLSYGAHPLATFWKHQIPLSLNADDPRLFGTDLTQEYLKAMEHSGFTRTDLQHVVQQSLAAAFLPQERKQILGRSIEQEWQVAEC